MLRYKMTLSTPRVSGRLWRVLVQSGRGQNDGPFWSHRDAVYFQHVTIKRDEKRTRVLGDMVHAVV